MHKADRIVRWPEVRQQIGLSRTTVWRKIREQDFPAPVRLTNHSIGWRQSDLDGWLASRQKTACGGDND
ncbi:AlpA family phage regulatory protein [Microvirga sp. HBU67558]|uniref:helix-turn-helix transcriptional regulator n=1 Tax=Microvirga TaxID=186650 RepID=UPI001B35CCFF|nr:AlpA family phage regulatory protein [Microvirga sp. HBU67558]